MKYEDALNAVKKCSSLNCKNSILVTTEKDILERKKAREQKAIDKELDVNSETEN